MPLEALKSLEAPEALQGPVMIMVLLEIWLLLREGVSLDPNRK